MGLKLLIVLGNQNIKIFFKKGSRQIVSGCVVVVCGMTFGISDLNGEEIAGTFRKKMQETN